MNRPLALAWLLIVALAAPPAWSGSGAATDPATAEARRAVESFCEADFLALGARDSLTTWSPSIKKAHFEDAGWPLVSWTWDSLTVVVAYRVGKVTTDDSTGSATVEYDEIARSVGRRRFVGLPRRATAVTLRLRKVGGTWRVWDPPEPRVSRDSLVACYAVELAALDQVWYLHASVAQVDNCQSLVAALRFLKNLK